MKIVDLVNGAWAITPEMLNEIQSIYARHTRSEKLNQKELMAAIGPRPAKGERRYLEVLDNGIAILSVQGVLGKKMNMFLNISGGTSMQMATDEFKEAIQDQGVRAVFMDVDSPGGSVDGTADMANAIRDARGTKPIVAFTDGGIFSAAYWIASAADKIIMSNETAMAGSIGVIARHVDFSKQLDIMGITETEITAGKYKSPYPDSKPLSEFGRQVIQDDVDTLYSAFVQAVSDNRGLDINNLEQWADGRCFIGQAAIDAGLVDGIISRDDLIAQMADGDSASGIVTAGGAVSDDGGSVSAKSTAVAVAVKQNLTPKAGGAEGPEMEEANMTKDELKVQHPEVYKAIYDEGVSSVETLPTVEALAEAKAEGAKAETQRVTDVRAQSLPGFETEIEAMVADGKTTGAEAAMAINKAQRDALEAKREDLGQDAKGLIAASEAAKEDEGTEGKKDFKALVAEAVDAGATLGAATSAMARKHPEAHEAYLTSLKKTKEE